MLSDYESETPAQQRVMEQNIRGATLSAQNKQQLAATTGRIFSDENVIAGAHEALDEKVRNIPVIGSFIAPVKSAGFLGDAWDAAADAAVNGASAAKQWWDGSAGSSRAVADGIGSSVAAEADRLVDEKLRSPSAAKQFGSGLVSGEMSGVGVGGGVTSAVADGLIAGARKGLATEQGLKNPLARMAYGFGSGNKAASMQQAFRDVGESAGKEWATMPQGLGDRAGDMVHGYAGSRLGGFGSGLFDPKNNDWFSAVIGGIGGGLGDLGKTLGFGGAQGNSATQQPQRQERYAKGMAAWARNDQ